MARVIRSEAALSEILARTGYKVREQFGSESVNTLSPGVPAPAPSVGSAHAAPAVQPGTIYAMVALCRAHGLPEPVPEYQFHPTRRWRFDYSWPMRMVALEVEGGIWTNGRHTRGSGAVADLEKYSEAAIAGWRVIYCTPGDLATLGLERVRRAVG